MTDLDEILESQLRNLRLGKTLGTRTAPFILLYPSRESFQTIFENVELPTRQAFLEPFSQGPGSSIIWRREADLQSGVSGLSKWDIRRRCDMRRNRLHRCCVTSDFGLGCEKTGSRPVPWSPRLLAVSALWLSVRSRLRQPFNCASKYYFLEVRES